MKNLFTLLLCCCLTLGGVMAQTEPPLKPQVFKSVYHDVSPPLRDMIKNVPLPADNSWKDGVVKNILYPNGLPKDEPFIGYDPTLQDWMGPKHTDTVLLSFDGTGNIANVYPPDTDGDVGPNYYFQCVNLSYAIYDKAGNKLLGPLANSTIWSGLPHNSNDGDAVVLYDEVNDRWIFSQFSVPGNPYYENIAVSQTNDPTGSWSRYQFSFGSTMPDYPKLGVWPDGIYMTSNMFAGGATAAGTSYSAFDKAAMYANAPTATQVMFTLPQSNEAWAALPSDCDGDYPPTGTPNFVGWLKSGHIRIYAFSVDWNTTANSSFTQLVTIPVAAYNGSVSGVPQPGTTAQLDAISGRIMHRFQFRKFSDHWSLVCNGTVNISGHAGIRWWELRNDGSAPANWSIYQEGTYSPDNTGRWMGSIAMDSQGNIALGYSASSSTIYPSIKYTGRLVTDPLNTMTIAETSIKDGTGSQTYVYGGRCRWGDYSAMAPDPSSPGKFWYTTEYLATTSSMAWKTRIGAFSIGNILMTVTSATPPTICRGDSSVLGVTASGGSGSYTYTWTSNPPGFNSTMQTPTVHPLATTTYIVNVSDGTQTVADSVRVKVNFVTSNAGNDTIYCSYVPVFTVHGTGTDYDQVLWQTLGDGTFDDPTAAVTQYHPMTLDKTTGVKLIFSVHSALPCHGLVSDTVHITFDPCTGLSDIIKRELNITVKPNPSNGIFDLTIDYLGNQTADVQVTDLAGHEVYHHTYQSAGTSLTDHLNLSYLPKGSYIMKVKTDTRNQVEKIILK